MHLVNSLIIGGAEVALLQYIQALGMEDYDHYVYSFGHDGPLRKKIEALGLLVYFGPKRAIHQTPRQIRAQRGIEFVELFKKQAYPGHSVAFRPSQPVGCTRK